MEVIFIALLGGGVGGSVLGYWLSSHIHSVASAATSNAVIGGAAAAISGAISTVQNDVKAIAAKIDHIVVAAPASPSAPAVIASPVPHVVPSVQVAPAAGPVKVP